MRRRPSGEQVHRSGATAEISALLAEIQYLADRATEHASRIDAESRTRRDELDELTMAAQQIGAVASFLEAAAVAAATGVVLASAEPGTIYFRTGENLEITGRTSLSLLITGNLGHQQFTYAHSTTQTDIIESINQFREDTGVSAARDWLEPHLVNLSSTSEGKDQFVRVRKLRGARKHNDFLLDERRSNPANAQKDFGFTYK